MKKANLLISTLAGLILFSGLAFAQYTPWASLTTANSATLHRGNKFFQVDFKGNEISPNSYFEINFDAVGTYDALDFKIASVSSGSVQTTANVIWETLTGDQISTETLTSGTAIVKMTSAWCKVRIHNNLSSTVNVTGNLLFTDD